MNKPVISLTEKTSYGVTRYYPANKLSELYCSLLDQQTLTYEQVQFISTSFDYEVELVSVNPFK
jgi:hypothetical protein